MTNPSRKYTQAELLALRSRTASLPPESIHRINALNLSQQLMAIGIFRLTAPQAAIDAQQDVNNLAKVSDKCRPSR